MTPYVLCVCMCNVCIVVFSADCANLQSVDMFDIVCTSVLWYHKVDKCAIDVAISPN